MELVTEGRITWCYNVLRRLLNFWSSPFLWLIRRLYSKSRSAHWLGINLILSRWFYYATYINTSADDQPDAQFLYFIIRSLQSSTCFEQRRAHHQEVKLY